MNILEKWKYKATEYVEVRLELLKLNVVDKSSSVLGIVMFSILMLFMAFMVLIFLGFSLRDTFVYLMDSRIAGSFTTFGVFLLLMIIIVLARKSVMNFFAGIFIRSMTDPGESEEHYKPSVRPTEEDDDEERHMSDKLHGKKVPVS